MCTIHGSEGTNVEKHRPASKGAVAGRAKTEIGCWPKKSDEQRMSSQMELFIQIVYFLVGICCDQSYMSKHPDCIVVIWELSITDTEPSGRVDSFDIPRRPRLTICRVHGLMQLTAKKLMSTKGPWIYQVAVLCYWDRRCGFPKVSCFNDAK
jgi:hypothetical protein